MAEIKTLKCEKCGGEMRQSRQISSMGLGIFVILLGIILLFVAFPIGTIIGIILIIVGFAQGGKRHFFWVCQSCGYKFEREGTGWEKHGL